MTQVTIRAELERRAAAIRRSIVAMLAPPKSGHLGGAMSCADILAVLYGGVMRHDAGNPRWSERDRFIMSKGHAALAQYAALAHCGYFPTELLLQFKECGCCLQGHPDVEKIPGIEANTGSLGQGLSVGLGLALAVKLDGTPHRIYVLLGDGECAEGQVWEAAMAAAAFAADNLIAIIDHNRLQATGPLAERMNFLPLRDKWEAFGWQALEVDGHDVMALLASLRQAPRGGRRPVVVIAHTVKGHGVPFAEEQAQYHNVQLTDDEYARAQTAVAQEDGHANLR